MSVYGGGFFSFFGGQKKIENRVGGTNDKVFFGISSGSNGCWLNSYLQAFKNIPDITQILIDIIKKNAFTNTPNTPNTPNLFQDLLDFFSDPNNASGNEKAKKIYNDFYTKWQTNCKKYNLKEDYYKTGQQEDINAFYKILENVEAHNNVLKEKLLTKNNNNFATELGILNPLTETLEYVKSVKDNIYEYNLQDFCNKEMIVGITYTNNIMFSYFKHDLIKINNIDELYDFITKINNETKQNLIDFIKNCANTVYVELYKYKLDDMVKLRYAQFVKFEENTQKTFLRLANKSDKMDFECKYDLNTIKEWETNISSFRDQLSNLHSKIISQNFNNFNIDEIKNVIDNLNNYVKQINQSCKDYQHKLIIEENILKNITSKYYMCFLILYILTKPKDFNLEKIKAIIKKLEININVFNEILNQNYRSLLNERKTKYKIILPKSVNVKSKIYQLKSIVYHSSDNFTSRSGHYVSMVFKDNTDNGTFLNDANSPENKNQKNVNFYPCIFIYSLDKEMKIPIDNDQPARQTQIEEKEKKDDDNYIIYTKDLINILEKINKDNNKIIVNCINYYINEISSYIDEKKVNSDFYTILMNWYNTDNYMKIYIDDNKITDKSILYNIYLLFKEGDKNKFQFPLPKDLNKFINNSNNILKITIFLEYLNKFIQTENEKNEMNKIISEIKKEIEEQKSLLSLTSSSSSTKSSSNVQSITQPITQPINQPITQPAQSNIQIIPITTTLSNNNDFESEFMKIKNSEIDKKEKYIKIIMLFFDKKIIEEPIKKTLIEYVSNGKIALTQSKLIRIIPNYTELIKSLS